MPTPAKTRIAVLASGRGSNFAAIISAIGERMAFIPHRNSTEPGRPGPFAAGPAVNAQLRARQAA